MIGMSSAILGGKTRRAPTPQSEPIDPEDVDGVAWYGGTWGVGGFGANPITLFSTGFSGTRNGDVLDATGRLKDAEIDWGGPPDYLESKVERGPARIFAPAVVLQSGGPSVSPTFVNGELTAPNEVYNMNLNPWAGISIPWARSISSTALTMIGWIRPRLPPDDGFSSGQFYANILVRSLTETEGQNLAGITLNINWGATYSYLSAWCYGTTEHVANNFPLTWGEWVRVGVIYDPVSRTGRVYLGGTQVGALSPDLGQDLTADWPGLEFISQGEGQRSFLNVFGHCDCATFALYAGDCPWLM